MRLKSGALIFGWKPEMYYAAGELNAMMRSFLATELTVTCGVAGRAYSSLHPKGLALDARTREFFDWRPQAWEHLPPMITFVDLARGRFEPMGYKLVLEPDELSAHSIGLRFSEPVMQREIGHARRDNLTEEEFGKLRLLITPHLHVEYRGLAGASTWPTVD
ncbi:MAG: hypothetical protein L0099_00995 [Acidobacteria bacterium]|nr:hypothetical protein [Acidobacteriota bacterium]